MRWFSCNKMSKGLYQLVIDIKSNVTTESVLVVSIGEYEKVLAVVTYVENYGEVKLVDIATHPNYVDTDLSKGKQFEEFLKLKA